MTNAGFCIGGHNPGTPMFFSKMDMCVCQCSVFLHRDALGWSVICNFGTSCLYSFVV